MSKTENEASGQKPCILHVSTTEVLRRARDQILRNAGYAVLSADAYSASIDVARTNPIELVLIDVQHEWQVREAEDLCTKLKSHNPAQRVAFVCNGLVAQMTSCPDEVVRSEFDPEAFLRGVADALRN